MFTFVLMKKIIIYVLFLLPVFAHSQTQKQGNVWHFGMNCGLDFSNGVPVNISGGQTGEDVSVGDVQEGTSCISDSAGNLLFYTGGETVWNRNHQPMPNGTGLYGGTSSTQNSIIIPLPQNDSLFYVFTADEFQGYNEHPPQKGYRYNIINGCMDSGLGDIIPEAKNILLADSSTEKLAACEDANGTGYWILGVKMFSNEYHAWHLTAAGITENVITNIGTIHGWNYINSSWQIPSAQGQMKISPQGNKVAVAISNIEPGILGLFDFDNNTGILSNPCHIVFDNDTTSGKRIYGVEFSPDGNKLYAAVSGSFIHKRLYQYDITISDCNAIEASRQTIYQNSTNTILRGMQLAPNGKIYMVCGSYYNLGCINSPNQTGLAANFDSAAVSLPEYNGYSLPSFISGYKYQNNICTCRLKVQVESTNFGCAGACNGVAYVEANSGQPPYTYLWSNSATSQTITQLCAGMYSVTVTDAADSSITDSIIISDGLDIPISITQNADTLYSTTAPNYQWYYNDTLIQGATDQTYIITQSGYYYVVTTSGGCTFTSNIIETTCLCTDISEIDLAKKISIYPNPAYTFLTLQVGITGIMNYYVYDVTGKELQSGKFIQARKIDVKHMPAGIYFVRIESEAGNVTKKFIKQ